MGKVKAVDLFVAMLSLEELLSWSPFILLGLSPLEQPKQHNRG